MGMTESTPPAELRTGQAMTMPEPWEPDSEAASRFFAQVSEAQQPLLVCDYDGTLAPFHDDKMQALPAEGVEQELQRIAEGRSALAFVTGRPAQELICLLPLAARCEIWGMHGREHRTAAGVSRLLEPTAAQKQALDAAEATLRDLNLGAAVERKVASVALHWRLAPVGSRHREELETAANKAFAPHADQDALALLPFDGGLELRADDHTKGHATAALLRAVPDPSASAYLGDDTTDEDAFREIVAAGGLPLLVREPSRLSHARYVVTPPAGLLAFLRAWH